MREKLAYADHADPSSGIGVGTRKKMSGKTNPPGANKTHRDRADGPVEILSGGRWTYAGITSARGIRIQKNLGRRLDSIRPSTI